MDSYSSQDDVYHCGTQTTCFGREGRQRLFTHAKNLQCFSTRSVTLVVHHGGHARRLKGFRVKPRSQLVLLSVLHRQSQKAYRVLMSSNFFDTCQTNKSVNNLDRMTIYVQVVSERNNQRLSRDKKSNIVQSLLYLRNELNKNLILTLPRLACDQVLLQCCAAWKNPAN